MEKQDLTLVQTRIVEGVWEGELRGVTGEAPTLAASYDGRAIDGLDVTRLPGKSGRYTVRLPIPPFVLSEGVQTILITLGDLVLARVVLVAGALADDDLRAEVSLLRAELDLLKRAFRRHCVETGG